MTRFPVLTKLGCFVLTEIAMDECLFPKTHREEDGGKDRARTAKHGCPMPPKDWLRLRETKKQTTRAKGKQVDGQATARDALSTQPRSGQAAKRIGQQAPIPSDRCWSSMGRETLARPSLHLRWRKRCCAKGLVRGAPSGEARFCALSLLVLYSVHRVLAVLFWLSPPVIPVWHHTSGSTAGSSRATKVRPGGTTPQYADAAVPCTGTIAPVLLLVAAAAAAPQRRWILDHPLKSCTQHSVFGFTTWTTRAGLFSYSGPSTMGTPWSSQALPLFGKSGRLQACKHIRLPSVPESPDLEPSFLPYPNTFFCWITFFSSFLSGSFVYTLR